MMKLQMPPAVRLIIEELEKNGFEGYAVGGCVRDACLGREPNDWDITTSASPADVKKIFRHTVDTGIAHGTVTVLTGGEGFEVTTYRIDGEYEDARHPKEVTFTGNLMEDLKRRDFTINAMAYNESTGLVDAFGGREDLKNGIIRCVGDAGQRFGEDALRMMRAVRFAAQLGFAIEKDTAEAAGRMAGNLSRVSAERIQTELMKLLMSDHPEMILDAWRLSLTGVFLPEFDALMETPEGPAAVRALQLSEKDRIVRLTLLLRSAARKIPGHERDGAESGQAAGVGGIMKRLRFDRDTMKKVIILSDASYAEIPDDPVAVRKFASQLGRGLFARWILAEKALLQGRKADGGMNIRPDGGAPAERERKLRHVEEIYQKICRDGDCLSLAELALTGKDLTADGMRPGREIGGILHQLLDEVLEEPGRNTREYLLKRSRELRQAAEIAAG